MRQSIVSGLRLTDRLEVIDGLQPGQLVVKKGFLGLAVGDKVKQVNIKKETVEATQPKKKSADNPASASEVSPNKNPDSKTGPAAKQEAADTTGNK